MTKGWRSRLTRNAEASWLFESFFVAAVVSFLGIRWFLALTDYPRIGSNGIQIYAPRLEQMANYWATAATSWLGTVADLQSPAHPVEPAPAPAPGGS